MIHLTYISDLNYPNDDFPESPSPFRPQGIVSFVKLMLQGAMQRIPNAPDTCLGEALLWFRKNMLTRAAGMRPNTPKKIIVMTDGKLEVNSG